MKLIQTYSSSGPAQYGSTYTDVVPACATSVTPLCTSTTDTVARNNNKNVKYLTILLFIFDMSRFEVILYNFTE